MNNEIKPLEDFKNLSLALVNEIKLISDDINIKTYSDICISFIYKHFEEYLKLYRSYIYIKQEEIKNYNFSILDNKSNITINNNIINLGDKQDTIFNNLFIQWDKINKENKKAIFDYLIYLNQLIETYNL